MSAGPIRLMHVIETLEVGGAEQVLANLVNLCSSRFVPSVCCFKRSGPVAAKLREGMPVFVMNQAPGNDYRIPFRLARLFSQNRIDVVVSHGWGVYLESVLARRFSCAQRMVHIAHGDFQPYPPSLGSEAKRRIRHWAEGLFSVGVHQFVAVSEGVKKGIVIQTGISSNRIRVVHNGVRIGLPDLRRRKEKRAALNVRPAEMVIGSVGRLAPVKNYSCLLTAFAQVRREASGVRLVLAGDGEERSTLEQLAERLGIKQDVFFLGQRTDVEDWLNVFDLFVLASSYEGISIAILEAMAMRLPVLATDVGGNREVVVDGETGWIVPPNDPEKMARAMLRLLRDRSLNLEMGHKGFERVKKHFNIEETVKAYEEIWKKHLKADELVKSRHSCESRNPEST